MTKQDIDDVFLMFAGSDSYLISIGDIVTLMDTAADAGQPLIWVLDPDRCVMMGADLEPWRPLAVDSQDLWLWRLDRIERPTGLPPFEWYPEK
ncbi:MAG: hypothetical protein ABSG62_24010 [Terracidiphilus sp.]|jgi:hypothetical protein